MHLLVAGKAHPCSQARRLPQLPHWSEQRTASYLMAYTSNHALGWGWNLMLLARNVEVEGGHIF
jgi:hypothetical protein